MAMEPDILEVPTLRSVNVMGTSVTRSPMRTARHVFSIWKQYPFEEECTASMSSSARRRNALNPAVVSRTGSPRTRRT